MVCRDTAVAVHVHREGWKRDIGQVVQLGDSTPVVHQLERETSQPLTRPLRRPLTRAQIHSETPTSPYAGFYSQAGSEEHEAAAAATGGPARRSRSRLSLLRRGCYRPESNGVGG